MEQPTLSNLGFKQNKKQRADKAVFFDIWTCSPWSLPKNAGNTGEFSSFGVLLFSSFVIRTVLLQCLVWHTAVDSVVQILCCSIAQMLIFVQTIMLFCSSVAPLFRFLLVQFLSCFIHLLLCQHAVFLSFYFVIPLPN
jgi:hypothetical protein